jgi:hypothetical protein
MFNWRIPPCRPRIEVLVAIALVFWTLVGFFHSLLTDQPPDLSVPLWRAHSNLVRLVALIGLFGLAINVILWLWARLRSTDKH